MALTNKTSNRIDLPHEQGQWIEARMPSLVILDQAHEVSTRKALKRVEGMDLAALKGLTPAAQANSEPDYDWQTLLTACITAWSYEEPVTPANIAELDKVTVDAVIAVLVSSETEGERKNG
jgi:hypothetical protein